MVQLPFNESLLLWSTPETESEPFIFDLINQQLTNGGQAVLLVTDKKAKTIINESTAYGYKFSRSVDKNLKVIDLSDDILKKADLKELSKRIKGSLIKNSLICFNNISVLINNYGGEAVKSLADFKQLTVNNKSRLVMSFTEWPYDAELISRLQESFTERVYLNTIDEGGFLRKYYSIKSGSELKHVMFRLERPGGVIDVSPRILVMEPESGIIESLSSQSVVIDQLSNGFRIDRGGLNGIDLIGATSDRFNLMMDLMSDQSTGVLVMVDSSKPDTITKARQVVNNAKKLGLSVVVGLKNAENNFKEVKNSVGVSGVSFVELSKNQSKEELIRKLLNY